MMMHAYDSIYLDKAAKVMGNLMHAAVVDQGFDGDVVLKQFVQSGIADEFERGNPRIIAGKSGAELLMDIQLETTGEIPKIIEVEHFDRSDAYWSGWMLARYQWYSNRRFADILDVVHFDDFLALYPTMHEADPQKCYEVLEMHFEHLPSKLKRVRKGCNLTQEELAARTGISLNTIRAYERRSKDINKAGIDILIRLANGLRCHVEELLD